MKKALLVLIILLLLISVLASCASKDQGENSIEIVSAIVVGASEVNSEENNNEKNFVSADYSNQITDSISAESTFTYSSAATPSVQMLRQLTNGIWEDNSAYGTSYLVLINDGRWVGVYSKGGSAYWGTYFANDDELMLFDEFGDVSDQLKVHFIDAILVSQINEVLVDRDVFPQITETLYYTPADEENLVYYQEAIDELEKLINAKQ